MREIACGREPCRCTLSSTSPEPFCCDECESHAGDGGRCDCGHEACGGLPGVTKGSPAREHPELDPTFGRQA